MNKLEQVENLRKKLVQDILEITGLSLVDFSVEISFYNQDVNDELATEARVLDWHPDRLNDSAWYTSEKPGAGSTSIYVE